MRTIISHFYNEEYLLPWWLEYHKKYFDVGILLDFGSTDNSIEIIRSICPNWWVIPSRFSEFDSAKLEYEMMFLDRQVHGWRIAIPVTEFLVGDIVGLTTDTSEKIQWKIPTIVFAEYDPARELDKNKLLWEQCHIGVHYKDLAMHNAWQCRSLHNYDNIFYMPGRHYSDENTDKAMIFKYSNVLVGQSMIKRKLQIQTKISAEDKIKNYARAVTHCSFDDDSLNMNNLQTTHDKLIGEPVDCTELMNSVLRYL